jgi:hypothetical protein
LSDIGLVLNRNARSPDLVTPAELLSQVLQVHFDIVIEDLQVYGGQHMFLIQP